MYYFNYVFKGNISIINFKTSDREKNVIIIQNIQLKL